MVAHYLWWPGEFLGIAFGGGTEFFRGGFRFAMPLFVATPGRSVQSLDRVPGRLIQFAHTGRCTAGVGTTPSLRGERRKQCGSLLRI